MAVDGFTVYDLIARNRQLTPNALAIIQDQERWTFQQLLGRVDALAAGLAELGLGQGERICILAQNDAAYLELYGACARQGLIAYPINWRLTPEEVARVLERAQPAMMVVDASCAEQVAPLRATAGISHWFSMGAETVPGCQPLLGLYHEGAPPPRPEVESQDPFVVISTAAVDIIPRGAILTHANIVASNMQSMQVLQLSAADRNLVALPLFHIAALGMTLALLHAGGCNVVMPRYHAAEAVELVDRHGITLLSDFPPVLMNLLDAADAAGSKLESLRIVSGLDGPETIARLEEHTNARFWTGFGQAETSGFITFQPFSERPGSAGLPGPMCQVRIVDALEREVPEGEEGEIVVRGPCVFKGYYDQPEATALTFRNGWHHTGDVGRLDQEGYLIYVRRKPEKELIKPGGENVYPAEVEAVIAELDGVEKVCVFGVSDPEWGEAVRAVVEAPAGHALDAEGVIAHVGQRIARFKRPKVVVFTEALPCDAQGEVDREAVKARWGEDFQSS